MENVPNFGFWWINGSSFGFGGSSVSSFSPFNENVIIEVYHREQVSLGKNINNEWITLRSRNAPSPILTLI
jgi:hypothetical protein